jgi:hypothetical protein
MNSKVQNQIHMVGACIEVAQKPQHQPVWNGTEPAGFAAEFPQLVAKHAAVVAKAAHIDAVFGGAADAKSLAESTLEEAAFTVARALAVHFKRTGDLERRSRVDLNRTQINRLRAQELVARATAIRDLGTAALGEPGAEGRGLTTASLASFTTAIETFSRIIDSPRGQIVNRSSLLRDLEADADALLDQVADLDDLAQQFNTTAAGRLFIDAWHQARMIVDSHGGRRPATNGNGNAGGNGSGNGPASTGISAPALAGASVTR